MPRKPASTLLSDLAGLPPNRNRRDICRLIEEVSKLPAVEHNAIIATVKDGRWSSRALATVLSKNGIIVSSGAIQNHRNGTCPCFRKATDQ